MSHPSVLPQGNLKVGDSATTTTTRTTKKSAASSSFADESRYSCDSAKLQALRSAVPWSKDAKFFQKVALSPSSLIKIMMHCQSGVEKGMQKGGNPIEVMGILLGRPDPTTPTTLVVTDAFPLPIEGFETRVIADDEGVVNHMIALGESLERTRSEKFMGWYHSHPFDVGDHSHCFLSQTDLSTQLQWQRAEDPHGNPFVAIVVDPLRSMHLQEPCLKAFRAFPPEYTSPTANECPNGTVQPVEQLRLEQWGSCWNRYYELTVEYYMSSTSRRVLEQLTQDYLWMRALQGQPAATSAAANAAKLQAAAQQLQVAVQTPASSISRGLAPPAGGGGSMRGAGGMSSSSHGGGGGRSLRNPTAAAAAAHNNNPRTKEWKKALAQIVDLASTQACETHLVSATKSHIFEE